MEQSKTEKSNTKPEMSIAKTEFTEDEKARIDKFTERHKREPIKFKTDKSSSAQPALQVHEKDNVLGYAKMMEAFGTPDRQLQDHLLGQVIQTFRGSTTSEGLAYDRLEEIGNKAMAFLNGIQPRDEIEGMLAIQMIGVHNLAMENLRKANTENHIEAVRLRTTQACKLSKIFAEQMEVLKKYRTGGQQKMVVEHVHVNEGGQAIVGTVQQGGGGIHERNRE